MFFHSSHETQGFPTGVRGGEGRKEVRNPFNAPQLLYLSCPLLAFRYIYSNTKLYILNLRCEIDI
jgi:hypothetical protein